MTGYPRQLTLFFLLLFLAPCLLKAQEKNTFSAGIRAGINGAQIDGDQMAGFNHLGAVGGLYVNYRFSQAWSGGFEMLYTNKGSNFRMDPDNPTQVTGPWYSLSLNYIEVPVLATFHFTPKFKAQGGLYASYLFGVKIDDASGGFQSDDFKKGDFGVSFGLSYRLLNRLSLYARYDNSLLPIGIGSSPNFRLNPNINPGLLNVVASFGVMYSFFGEEAGG